MSLLAIDVSLQGCGWAILDQGILFKAGVESSKHRYRGAKTLALIGDNLAELISRRIILNDISVF